MAGTETLLFWTALPLYVLSSLGYWINLIFKKNLAFRIAVVLLAIGWVMHTFSLISRWSATGHPPLATGYEFLSVFAWSTVLAGVITERLSKVKAIGVLVVPIAWLIMGAAWLRFEGPSPLLPALKSYWLYIHVSITFVAYSVFAVSFGTALLYLLQERTIKVKSGGILLRRLPPLEVMDDLFYRTVAFGFPLLTMGILAGAIWAEEAWGRYWGWDAKETWSLITWLVYGAFLHARVTAGWTGRRAAILAIIGFASVLFTFFGVNYLSEFHGYAGK